MTGDRDRCNGSAGPPAAGNAPCANGASPHTNGAKTADNVSHIEEKPSIQPPSATSSPQYRFSDICYKLRLQVLAFLEKEIPESDEPLRNVQSQVRVSVDVIEEALRRYSLDQISLSYNGGKDCLVLLILILACLPICNEQPASTSNEVQPQDPQTSQTLPTSGAPQSDRIAPSADAPGSSAAAAAVPTRPFQAIYIVPPDPFPEVDEFVDDSIDAYNLDLARYPLAMRAALDAYLADRPAVQAIFMGTRRTDPHGEFLTHFTPTDAGWPQFMRIHPVIDWHYTEIWGFIRYFDIPFCSLYNRGFTSLGGTTDTRPNPVLVKSAAGSADGDSPKFRPAYELVDDEEERLGRGR